MNMRLMALMLVVPAAIAAKAQSGRRMTVDDLFQLVESNSKTLQEAKISVEFARKGIEAARSQRLPDVNATLSASYNGNVVVMNRDFTNANGYSSLPIERLYLPTFLRTFGYGIFFSTMTIYLKDLIEFPTFFMALTVSGFIRNGVAESICSGLYSYGLRRQIGDALSRGIHADYSQVLMVAVKEMFGIMCIIGTFTLLFMLLYDVQPVRSTMRRMMPLRKMGKFMRMTAKNA